MGDGVGGGGQGGDKRGKLISVLPSEPGSFLVFDEGKWFWEKMFRKKEGSLAASLLKTKQNAPPNPLGKIEKASQQGQAS